MNERIEKLGEQADLLGEFTPTKIPGRYVGYITEEQILKFAELIVQECADISLKSGNIANKNIAAKIESERIYHKIKEHFGVEE
jgi:hypothetical protein